MDAKRLAAVRRAGQGCRTEVFFNLLRLGAPCTHLPCLAAVGARRSIGPLHQFSTRASAASAPAYLASPRASLLQPKQLRPSAPPRPHVRPTAALRTRAQRICVHGAQRALQPQPRDSDADHRQAPAHCAGRAPRAAARARRPPVPCRPGRQRAPEEEPVHGCG